jgi:hypothetical protein
MDNVNVGETRCEIRGMICGEIKACEARAGEP